MGVLDMETAPLMVEFHRLLAAGCPAATALASAQQQIAGQQPTGISAVAPFVCLGAGFTAPDPHVEHHEAANRRGVVSAVGTSAEAANPDVP
jgi:CHAT domain-containing protein